MSNEPTDHEAEGAMRYVMGRNETRDYHGEIKAERDALREDLKHMEGLAEQYLSDANKLTAERDAYRDNAEKMNDAATRYMRRAHEAERRLDERVTELLEANNRLLERARRAEGERDEAVKAFWERKE